MAPYYDFIRIMLVMAMLLALAIGFLLWRDRRTLRPDMSPAERRRAVANNASKTAHWWHIAGLAAILNVLLLEGHRLPHQRVSAMVLDAALAAFLVFRYYRKRSEETIKADSDRNRPAPIH
jgi:hypothetical protein